MPWFFQKKEKKDVLTEDQKIELVQSVYTDFEKKLTQIEKERDEKIMQILSSIDNRKIHDIIRRIETT